MPNWTEIKQSKEFRALKPDEQASVRDDFFERSIAPKVPADHLDAVKADFYKLSDVKAAPEHDKLELSDGGFQGSSLGGVVQGGRDLIDAGAQALSHMLPEGARKAIDSANNYIADKTGLVGRLPEGGIDEKIKQDEASYQQARAAAGRGGIDAARITGNIAGTLPLASAKALQLAKGKSAFDALNLAKAAAQGGIVGAAQPVTQGNFGEEKLRQIGTGAGFGAAMAPVGAAIGRMISPKVNPEVQSLMSQGVTPTPGQVMGGAIQRGEDKLMSIPLLGDAITAGRKRAQGELNQAAYARALVGTGIDAKTLPVGREGIAQVRAAVGNQYDDLLPKLSFKPDAQFAQEISKINEMAQRLPKTDARQFNTILKDINSQVSKNGSMLGKTYKEVESMVSSEARQFSASSNVYEKKVGAALNEVLSSMKSNLSRSNPQHAKELAQANSNYANYVRLRHAGSAAGDQSGGFTSGQLAAAVKGSDKSVGKGNVATGNALMQDLSDAGVNVLGSKYPDSGTAGRGFIAALMGAGAAINPAILGVGAAGLPYTPAGQRLMANLLTKRPAGAKALSSSINKLAPLFGAALSK